MIQVNYVGVKTIEFRVEGKLHRVNGPARIHCDEAGHVLMEWYFREGKLHREDGPAMILYGPAGEVTSDFWFHEGEWLWDR